MTPAGGVAAARAVVPWLVLALAVGCARELTLGSDQQSMASAGTAGAAHGGTGGTDAGGAGQPSCVQVKCRGTLYKCGNCMDDDGDGRIDAQDLECTGPCDDLEDSLSVGLPGESALACQEDCYFDRGNGANKSDCHFSHQCDMRSVAPDYPPTGQASCVYDESIKIPGTNASCADLRAQQPAGCAENCGPLTPNGCDCFGCCELPAGSGKFLWLETELPCTPVEACRNHCDPCEACVGRPDPLPSCEGSGGMQCPPGYDACGADGGGACRNSSYCVTGCCIPEPR